jgi:hypothetical protein
MLDRETILIECQRIVRLTAALAAAIERLGEAVEELLPPPEGADPPEAVRPN